jgi:hypothetical protein
VCGRRAAGEARCGGGGVEFLCVANTLGLPLPASLLVVSGAPGASHVDRDGLGTPYTVLSHAGREEALGCAEIGRRAPNTFEGCFGGRS